MRWPVADSALDLFPPAREERSGRLTGRRAGKRLDVKRLIMGTGLGALGAILLVRSSVVQKVRSRRDQGLGLDELHKDELYRRAQDADIPGRSQMTKQELIEALRGLE